MNIDLVDVMYFGGLTMFGAGTYLWFGLPVSLALTGIILVITGAVGSLKG